MKKIFLISIFSISFFFQSSKPDAEKFVKSAARSFFKSSRRIGFGHLIGLHGLFFKLEQKLLSFVGFPKKKVPEFNLCLSAVSNIYLALRAKDFVFINPETYEKIKISKAATQGEALGLFLSGLLVFYPLQKRLVKKQEEAEEELEEKS